MEFELGLKLTRTREDDLTSMADLWITKDSSGPLFVSKETNSKFILTGHLKGFRKENIDITINESGNRISIGGKRPVQEMVLRGWIMQKKEAGMNVFRKVFWIPEGVILDKIKATWNDEMSNLTIIMPKLAKGRCGVVIEEVKEEEVDNGRPEATQDVVDKTAEDPEVKLVAKEVPKEGIMRERIEGKRDPGQVVEPAIGEGKPEEAEEKVDGGESRTLQNAAEAETGRVEERIRKESVGLEVKSKEENYQIIKESSGGTETASSKPEEETEISKTSEPLQADDILRDKIPEEKAPEPGLEKHVPGTVVAKSVESGDDQGSVSTHQVEEKHTTSKDHQVETEKSEDLQKKEPLTEIEELKKPEEPCQAPETEEAQGNEIDSSKEKDDQEDTAQKRKHVPKRNKVCPPLVAAGSTLLVSLIVLVFQLIRAKKR